MGPALESSSRCRTAVDRTEDIAGHKDPRCCGTQTAGEQDGGCLLGLDQRSLEAHDDGALKGPGAVVTLVLARPSLAGLEQQHWPILQRGEAGLAKEALTVSALGGAPAWDSRGSAVSLLGLGVLRRPQTPGGGVQPPHLHLVISGEAERWRPPWVAWLGVLWIPLVPRMVRRRRW
ncbi:hypothetical protein NDU88_005708 [Pleurodeles waltl]|uniref:Uncharacterized protein n=1 Tax=Pleurodeles waltl TaxID=8319 RepID=A0AAV7PGQ0_PLEWA|nr:hypothetical protein NDU88_005708 [Pleurodeles waltl]